YPRRQADTNADSCQLALGHPDHRRNKPPAGPRARLTTSTPTRRPGRTNPRARGTPPARRDSRAVSHGQTLKKATQPQPQPATPKSRKIEAKTPASPTTCGPRPARPASAVITPSLNLYSGWSRVPLLSIAPDQLLCSPLRLVLTQRNASVIWPTF